MRLEITVDVLAAPTRVWGALMDVEAWPSWTPSMTSVSRVGHGPIELGSAVRIEQPKIGTLEWTVTEFSPGRSFSWEARRPGLTVEASHTVTPDAGHGSTVLLSVRQAGPIGTVIGPFVRRMVRANVNAEAQGLKTFCESS